VNGTDRTLLGRLGSEWRTTRQIVEDVRVEYPTAYAALRRLEAAGLAERSVDRRRVRPRVMWRATGAPAWEAERERAVRRDRSAGLAVVDKVGTDWTPTAVIAQRSRRDVARAEDALRRLRRLDIVESRTSESGTEWRRIR